MPRLLFILLAALPLLGAGCPCDTDDDSIGPPFCLFLRTLTKAAFGEQTPYEPPPNVSCPARLVCDEPDCVRVEFNGGFERFIASFSTRFDGWDGDETSEFPRSRTACEADHVLEFMGTTPMGPSPSRSSQVYQTINYNDVVPASRRATMRRVRAQAPFILFPSLFGNVEDNQFGLRILAFSGNFYTFDNAAFEIRDAEDIPRFTADWALLDSVDVTAPYTGDGEIEWQALRAQLWLPDDTDFFVVLLEAYEDVENDVEGVEFVGAARMDRVEITIDEGNTAPIAAPDFFSTLEDQASGWPVLSNDDDATSRFDLGSIAIERPPDHGTATTPEPDGTVLYTPDPGFLGTDTFTYTFADVEGLRSNEAEVTVEVVLPRRFVVADHFNSDTQDRWQVQVRGSSTGPTGIAQTVRHETAGGNPGGFRAMTHRIDGEGNLFVTHVYTFQPYVPAEHGTIVSLSYSEDRLARNSRAVGARFVVWQGGQIHRLLLSTFSNEDWATEAVEGLTADDFTPVPDFSATGDTLWFGYERANTNTNPNAVQFREHWIDNWEVEVIREGSGAASARRLDTARRDR